MKKVLSFAVAIAAMFALAMPVGAQTQEEAMQAMMRPLPNDPAVKVGNLENGLTYYIRHNDKPAQRAEFYLATNVGAIQEEPDQDGLAHFLEHMCFNGTKRFPDKGILDYLRSIGAEFGRNINASTGVEETQYMLNNIPVARESVVDSCLMILCEYAHFVENKPEEIDKERGVIIEERRQRRNASWRMHEKSLPYYYGDTKYGTCTLIGLQESLENFKPESLVNFYQTWYHPGNQAVVVVGDVDVDRTEQKIKEIFSVIPKQENPKAKDVINIPGHKDPVIGVITDPEATTPSVEMLWQSDAMPELYNNTIIGFMQDNIKGLLGMVMRERFEDITSKPDSPFLNADLGIGHLCETCEVVMGNVVLKEDNLLDGFKAFYTEIEKMKRFGFADDEVGRAKTNLLNMYENAVKKAETRKNPEFVRPILQNFFDNQPYMEPQAEYELAQQLLSQINSMVLSQFAAQIITDENLVVLYKGPEKEGLTTPTVQQLKDAIDFVKSSDIKANESVAVAESFLDPASLKGSKVKKQNGTVYGAEEWILKNGAKVLVLPTDYTKDQIIFTLFQEGGRSLIETADLPSFDENVWALYLNNTGIAGFSGTETSKMLTGKTLNVNPFINSLSNGVSGSCSVKDLETALQLTYLDYVAPRFDNDEFQNGINQIAAVLPNLMNQPNYKFSDSMYKTLYGNNPRRLQINDEILGKADLQTLENVYRKLFNDAAGLTAIFVGDIDKATLKPLVEKYIGSLKKGKKAPKWIDRNEDIVTGKVENVISVDMQTPKSTVLNVYSAPVKYSVEKEAALDAAKYILDIRYVNSLREDEGGTYGASVMTDATDKPKDRAMIQVYFDSKPALTDKLRTLTDEGIRALAKDGPTDEEISSAILNLQKKIPESRISNNYWRTMLRTWVEDGILYDSEYEQAVNSLTAQKVKDLVAEILASGNLVEMVMVPANAAEAE